MAINHSTSRTVRTHAFPSDRRECPEQGGSSASSTRSVRSVGKEIGEQAFADWLATQTASTPRDDNAVRIADVLWPLIEQGVLRIPRPGYLVKRGRGRIVVEPADS